MAARDKKIEAEALELWRRLYGEAPPADMGGSELLARITGDLPEAAYARFESPHLRPTQIVFPVTRNR